MTISRSAIVGPTEPHSHIIADRCPWCDQPIPHEKFNEIKSRMAAEERERTAELERRLKEQVAREKAQADANAKAQIEQGRKETAAMLERVRQEASVKEAAAREEAKKVTEAAMAPKLAQAEHATKVAERQLQALQANHESTLNQRLQEQRDALEKAMTQAINVERSKTFNDKLKLEEKVQELQRQLQKKTADELGEGAEIDLYEKLREQFPDDQITRVAKGSAGADIIHNIVYKGELCGSIIYDSKNRNAWRNDYVVKLREDQLAAKADHAILSTHVFPAGTRQLHMQDGVVVTNPARAMVLVELLRKHVVQIHTMRLSNEARGQKTDLLYEFITSDRCTQLLDQIETLTDDMLELDVKEQKAHSATWNRRGDLIRSVQRVYGNFTSEIERIIGTAASAE